MTSDILTESLKLEPWWWEAAPRQERAGELPATADALIVGAGFTGLSAALTLARAGRAAVVIDAGLPGAGASSRNGGMIGSGHRRSFAYLSKLFGETHARDFIREGLASLEYTYSLIEQENIDCHLSYCGRFRGAWRSADYDAMGREVDFLRREFGVEIGVVPRAEQYREVATERYHGGIVYRRHGGLHPGLFHSGLMARVESAGATVVGNRPVRQIAREGAGFKVLIGEGNIACRNVIVATNGYTGAATQNLRRRIVPVPSYIIATEPLSPDLVQSLIPGGRMIVETRARHCYYRASPDGRRILLGARAAVHVIGARRSAGILRNLLVDLFPQLEGVRISHSWTGFVGMTREQLPHVGCHDGLHVAMGYSGSGVAMAPYLGHKAALQVLGDAEGRTVFERTAFSAIPFYRGNPWFLLAFEPYYRFRDLLDSHGA